MMLMGTRLNLFAVLSTLLLQLTCWQNYYTAAFFGGAWCPYKSEKLIPCRVPNGTESYLGPNICWRNLNGTFMCTKKTLTRPKFVTTYKRVTETIYKCCPGLRGHNCQTECFNCSTIESMQNRLGHLETRLSQIQVFPRLVEGSEDGTYGSGLRQVTNSIGDDDDDEDLVSVLNLAQDLRSIERRLATVESQLSNLLNSLGKFVNPWTTEATTIPVADQKVTGPPVGIIQQADVSDPVRVAETSDVSAARPQVRPLERNLERGDIASTLNDDYGDEHIPSSHTEEYVDQLYNHNLQ